MENVQIFDTTLRDGEQSPGFSMNTRGEAAAGAANGAARRGCDRGGLSDFLARRPGSGARGSRGNQAIAEWRRWHARVRRMWTRRCEGIEPAAKPRLHIFLATSDLHLKHKLRISRGRGAGANFEGCGVWLHAL